MPSGQKQPTVNENMAVERGYGPPDKDNEIELETGIGLAELKKSGQLVVMRVFTHLQIGKIPPWDELGQMIISCTNDFIEEKEEKHRRGCRKYCV